MHIKGHQCLFPGECSSEYCCPQGQESSFPLERGKHLTLANAGKIESMNSVCVSEEEGALLCCWPCEMAA